ncbi:hypothetical protein BDZ45DRAFT_131178 [Acephala macrosclerotiorum]|nr:hypothetical protein BDZ45DRAFT_131178 [Acephala macrosclerotiorum]
MGGWDVYCAFCGAAFSAFDAFGEEEFQGDGGEGSGYDRKILSTENLEWLEKGRVIGFNPEAFGVRKCFISGRGDKEEYGSIGCDYGDDPNFPRPSGSYAQNNPGKVSIVTYSNYDPNEPLAIPFHEDCFILLSKAIYYHLYGNVPPNLGEGEKLTGGENDLALGFVSKDALYAALKKLYVMDSYGHYLTEVDYGELSEMVMEQYWCCFRGQEAWVSNPLTSPQLKTFFFNAQDLGRSASSPPPVTASLNLGSKNPFTKFSTELIAEILLSLPLASLKSFALSGLAPSPLAQDNAFWHRKTNLDFPFLYDFPALEGERNWLVVYRELQRQCYPNTPVPALQNDEDEKDDGGFEGGEDAGTDEGDQDEASENALRQSQRDTTLVLSIANRRRVWGICQKIIPGYIAALKELEGDDSSEAITDKAVVESSLSLQMPIVANPLANDEKAISTYFISEWEDLKKGLTLSFWFEDDDGDEKGRLCGVEVQGKRVFGTRGVRFDEPDKFTVEEGVWVEALVFVVNGGSENALKDSRMGITAVELLLDNGKSIEVGDQTGDKRLLKINDGMVVTGLIGELGNGIITRLGLLQAPNPNPLTLLPPSKIVPQIQKPLWHTSLPPSHLHAAPYETGYWTPSRSYDTIPMPFILFSPDGSFESLGKLKGIEADPNLRCWGVKYAERQGKRTGPMDKMDEVKMFKIDGEGGERVVKVEIGMNNLVMGLKITTNRDRLTFFGKTQKNYHVTYEETEKAFIAGLYISWGYGDDRRYCSTASVLAAAKPGRETLKGKIEGAKDQTAWSPSRLEDDELGHSSFMHIALVDESEYEEYKEMHW